MNFRLMALNIKQFCPQLSIPVIKQRINVRYQQVIGMEDWEFLNESTTQAMVVGTSEYTPAVGDVSKILGVKYQSVLAEKSRAWFDNTDPERESEGTPRYWREVSKSSALGEVTYEVWPVPDAIITLTILYKKTVSNLSADTDEPVFRSELLEAGSLWDCYRLTYGVTQNPAYMGMARDAFKEYEMLSRQMIIEDLAQSSLPLRVRESNWGNMYGNDFNIDHDVWRW